MITVCCLYANFSSSFYSYVLFFDFGFREGSEYVGMPIRVTHPHGSSVYLDLVMARSVTWSTCINFSLDRSQGRGTETIRYCEQARMRVTQAADEINSLSRAIVFSRENRISLIF
jgi:hypothetical protein